MEYIKKVIGSGEMAIPVYVGKDRIDVHYNIEQHQSLDPDGKPIEGAYYYTYDEEQYTYEEFFDTLHGGNEELKELCCDQDLQIEELKEALCDLDNG